jgi:hypothetical protein
MLRPASVTMDEHGRGAIGDLKPQMATDEHR